MFLLQISPPFGLSRAPADSVPEMRLNSSTGVTHSPVYLAHILPKSPSKNYLLAMAAGDLPWPVPGLWQLMWRSTLYWKEFEGAHRYLELCWALLNEGLCRAAPCSLWVVQPPWLSTDSWAVCWGAPSPLETAGPGNLTSTPDPANPCGQMHMAMVGPSWSFVWLAWAQLSVTLLG